MSYFAPLYPTNLATGMSSINPKKHHYVSQFLLKNFCEGGNKRLFVLDKKLERIYKSSLLDTGSEKYFYKSTDLNFHINTETKLSHLESTSAPIFSEIIRQESIAAISHTERTLLCLFASVQHLRTNNQRTQIKQINELISKSFRSDGIDPNKDVENFCELSQEDIKNASINNLHSLGAEMAEHFINKEITLVKAPDMAEFYISDHPIVLYNHFPRAGRGNLGLGLRGIEMQFPLSPKLCLVFFCSETVMKLRNSIRHCKAMKPHGIDMPLDMSEPLKYLDNLDAKATKILKHENVEFNNSLQVSQSSRFIYSHNGNFDLAIDMLKTNPELKDPMWFST